MANDRVECKYHTCNRSFESHDSMEQHFSASHSQAEVRYACDFCNRSFSKPEGLQDHMRSFHLTSIIPADRLHCPQSFACNDCGKGGFQSADALHQHQWASDNHTHVSKSPNPKHGTRVRACSECNMELPTAEDLEQHYVQHHPIREMPKSGEGRTWQQVEECFRSAWTDLKTKVDKVHCIFNVYNPGLRRMCFEEYRKEIKVEMSNQRLIREDNLKLRNQVLCNGNELEQYYGTTVRCKLGQPPMPKDNGSGSVSLCIDEECSLCQILKAGLKKTKYGVKDTQRFGEGIYCSASSSKTSAYVRSIDSAQKPSNYSCFGCCESTKQKGKYKVMLVCRVIAGRPYRSTCDLQDLKGPPCGFHSVQGDPGDTFNHEELVVYDDRAIVPAYIIVYSTRNWMHKRLIDCMKF